MFFRLVFVLFLSTLDGLGISISLTGRGGAINMLLAQLNTGMIPNIVVCRTQQGNSKGKS